MAGKRGGPRPNSGGKRAGAGRPPKELTELRREMQAAFIERAKPQFEAIVDKTVQLALAGDSSARSDVLKYLCGQPTQPVEVSGPNGKPVPIQLVEVVLPEPTGGD